MFTAMLNSANEIFGRISTVKYDHLISSFICLIRRLYAAISHCQPENQTAVFSAELAIRIRISVSILRN